VSLKGLSARGRGLQAFLKSAVEAGMGANETLKVFQDAGVGYKRSTFLSDFRVVSGAEEIAERMKYVGRESVVSEDLYSPGFSRTKYKYLTRIKATVYDTIADEERSVTVTVGHDTVLRRLDIEEAASDIIETSPILVEDLMPIGGTLNVLRP